DSGAVQRFRREAEAAGRIAHPGIVPVYGTGETDGIQWFAMEFVDGPPLSKWVEELGTRQVEKLRESLVDEVEQGDRYPSLREPKGGTGNRYVRSCARLCADVANALAAAHKERVVHRDIKPNNIMVHSAGRPVVLDFGLARDEQNTSLTRSGEQLGTPAYMAPEQARGSRQLDSRVDVYGLGAVLYELLTLQPPFHGGTAAEIVHQILTEDAVPVQRRNPNVPVDLAAIVHRCLQKDRDERYPAIEAVESDLRAFLDGQKVTAKLPTAVARLQSRLQRHRKVLVASTTAVTAAVAIAVLAGIVDDRGDVRAGHALLDEARAALLVERSADRARDLYERAAALTKQPELVRERRQRDFADAFEVLYSSGADGPSELRRFAAVFDESERVHLRLLLDRLDGRGAVRFLSRALELATKTIEVRKVEPAGLAAEWQLVRLGEALPIGEYLVRATSHDGATSVLRTTVETDQTTQLEPHYLGAGQLPIGSVAAIDPSTQRTIAVGECEVTRGAFRAWLSTLSPPLRAEMTPSVWSEDPLHDELPVRGLSFHQARTFAQANGAHLPTAREQWLAGSAGLVELQLPWGTGPDAARLVADPFQRSEAEPVRSLEQGRSPLGAFHVLGNVAEVLAADRGALRLGGGSFADDPNGLRLDGKNGTVPVQSLASVFAPHAAAGLRLYHFVPSADDVGNQERALQRRKELERSVAGCVFHDWELRRDGTLSCDLELVSVYDGGRRERLLYLDTKGFLQIASSMRAVDGHGRALPIAAGGAPGGEQSVLSTELPAQLRAGQGFRFKIGADLQPGPGLCPSRDAYVLRLPMARGHEVAHVYTLALPANCVVEEVTPAAQQWQASGRTWLAWEQTAFAQIETAVVRFFADGSFGTIPGERAAALDRCDQFLRAWSDRSPQLDRLLDVDFVQHPGGLDRKAARARETDERIVLAELVDTVRIGAIETCELRVDWTMTDHDGRPFELRAFPLLLQWRHAGSQVGAVRMQPFTMADQGRYETPQTDDPAFTGYANDGLRIRIDHVPGTVLVRTQDELCELQVEMVHADGTARVVGCFADANDTPDAIRFRLTNGASIRGRGTLLRETSSDMAQVQEWSFQRGSNTVRERWQFLQKGRRHLLVRFATVGTDARAAAAKFDSAATQAWFASVAAAVRVE
ncbi:MAG: protein kinase, partial [Planctomycetota bacterium]